MAPINFNGKLPVAVVLQWKGDVVSGALTKAFENFRYVVANDFVTAFKVEVGGSSPTVIERKAAKGKPFYDTKLNTFTTEPTSGSALDVLIANKATTSCTIDLTFKLESFFDVLLTQMTRTDGDLHNLANPNDSKAILDTFVHNAAGGKITITYKSTQESLKAVPCKLVDFSVTPIAGKAPGVKLVFELDFSPFDNAKREAMRKLIALDWCKLARFGKPVKVGERVKPDVEVWFVNRNTYVLNHTDINRAASISQGIVDRQKGKSPEVLSRELRDDIDLHLITANHWGQAREDMKTERHQRLLSDLFGTLHQTVWMASPVNCLRTISEALKFDADSLMCGNFALQYGVGHCGEHSQASFSILSLIMSEPGNKVSRIVKTGNANIDHAFVVYDLDVASDILLIATNPRNTRCQMSSRDEEDKTVRVWNLREAIAKNTRPGFVMDPYLDKTIMKPTAKELLDALNRDERKKMGKDTDFLAFDEQFPPVTGFVEEDLRGESVEVRKRRVKNV